MAERYMLDTNSASYVIKGTYPAIRQRLVAVPMTEVCISVITQAELLFGLMRKPDALGLKTAVQEFLLRIEILPWESQAAQCYANLRRQLELDGKSLGSLDMLIAAHSIAEGTTLVTHDRAFRSVKHMCKLEDWSA